MGTVEVILIILVLIGLVIIFKSQLTDLVESIFTKSPNRPEPSERKEGANVKSGYITVYLSLVTGVLPVADSDDG